MSTKSSIGSSRVAMKGQFNEAPTGGYKMSKSVPFLPAFPALEGYAGEEVGFDPMPCKGSELSSEEGHAT